MGCRVPGRASAKDSCRFPSRIRPETVDEERRLLYVGITRAREHLFLSWSTARTPGGRANRKPSRFLDGLRPDSVASSSLRGKGAAPRRKAAVPASCRVCGTMLSSGAERKVGRCNQCPPSYEEQTFDALRQWRKDVALAAEVPAFVVFTDATLTAIAEARPTSMEELAGIAGRGSVQTGKVRRSGPDGARPKAPALMAGRNPAGAAPAATPEPRR